jgi:hypothetical protein
LDDDRMAAAVAMAASHEGTPRPVATRKAPWILFGALLITGVILLLWWLGYLG